MAAAPEVVAKFKGPDAKEEKYAAKEAAKVEKQAAKQAVVHQKVLKDPEFFASKGSTAVGQRQ